jgi:hypothetical protein
MDDPVSSRRVLANLGCEVDFAAPAARQTGRHHGPGALSRAALESISTAATLLRVFCDEGDRLWTPLPVPQEQALEIRGLPHVELESGPLEDLEPATATLAWGETAAVAALRKRNDSAGNSDLEDDTVLGTPLYRTLWALAPPEPAAAAAANHRGFALDAVRELGCALPGARLVESLGELEAHLQSGGARYSGGRWVVKAPFSASGRDRCISRTESLSTTERRRVVNLLLRHGALLFEPWMDRTADFGACGVVTSASVRYLGAHGLEVDAAGRFRGIAIAPRGPPGLEASEAEALWRTTVAVGKRLRGLGYRGPFGVDAWRYRDREGAQVLHPLGEVNARMTFGLVARAMAERLTAAGTLPSEAVVRLRFGQLPVAPAAAAYTVIPLVVPAAGAASAAWLEADRG